MAPVRPRALRGQALAGAVVATVAALVLVWATPVAAAGADVDDGGSITVTIPDSGEEPTRPSGDITDAEFRWGINQESGSGAFAGGCNFLSAGRAGNAGGAKVWTEADRLYRAVDGAVSIVKADRAGSWVPASFDTKCLDRYGDPVAVTDLEAQTETQVVMRGGVGARAADGSVSIRWSGSFTVVFYGGMSYWSVTDPVLTMDASGDGVVRARLSGYATSQSNLGQWDPVSAADVVIADVEGASISDRGFAKVPDYLGVTAAVGGQAPFDVVNLSYWGAFPATFLQFQARTGQAGYWMTTGGQRDRAKLPSMLYVNYSASDPAVAATPGAVPATGTGSPISNPVTRRPPSAPAAAAVAGTTEPTASFPTGSAPASVSASDGALVPASSGGLPAVVLPAAATLLAVLLAVLATIDLAGVRIRLRPWRAP